MAEWYQDVLRGVGLTAIGATSAAAGGGGQLGAVIGGLYGATKAGLGTSFDQWYQVSAPAAVGGLALYPSAKAADVRLNAPGGIAGDPSRLSVQSRYLGSELSGLFSGANSGVVNFVNKGAIGAADSVAAGGTWFGELVKGTGKGLTDFVNKGGLVNLLGGLKAPTFVAPGTGSAAFPSLPSIMTYLGGQPATAPGGGAVGIPIPGNNSSVGAPAAGVPAWLLAALVLGTLFLFRKKLKLA